MVKLQAVDLGTGSFPSLNMNDLRKLVLEDERQHWDIQPYAMPGFSDGVLVPGSGLFTNLVYSADCEYAQLFLCPGDLSLYCFITGLNNFFFL